jgi:hypothetical protein
MTDYPEVQALVDAVRELNLVLSVEPPTPELDAISYRRIRVESGDGRVVIIPVDDEYGDATDDNPELLLHLVLAACQVYEESEDALAWVREAGVQPASPLAADLFRESGEAVRVVRAIVGDRLQPISSWDFTLNTGAAQRLRRL